MPSDFWSDSLYRCSREEGEVLTRAQYPKVTNSDSTLEERIKTVPL